MRPRAFPANRERWRLLQATMWVGLSSRLTRTLGHVRSWTRFNIMDMFFHGSDGLFTASKPLTRPLLLAFRDPMTPARPAAGVCGSLFRRCDCPAGAERRA